MFVTVYTLYRKSDLCIPRKETARLHSHENFSLGAKGTVVEGGGGLNLGLCYCLFLLRANYDNLSRRLQPGRLSIAYLKNMKWTREKKTTNEGSS